MTKNQTTTKGKLTLTELSGNRKRNTGNRTVSRKVNKKSKVKKPVRVNAALKGSIKEEEIKLPAEFLKKMRTLRALCRKIDKLEKEKRKIIHYVLKDNEKSA